MPIHSARMSPLVRSTRRHPLSMIEHGALILELLVSLRFATGGQVQRVVFNATSVSERQARHRSTRALRRLFDAGFTRRASVFAPSSTGRMAKQTINVLSAAGARSVGVDPAWIRRRAPTADQILTHDFWLVEVAVLAMAGCPAPLGIVTWWDDRLLAARKRRGQLSLPNIPDGYLLIENLATGKLFPCLVELDLGTEVVTSPGRLRRDFAGKIEGYLPYLGGQFRSDFAVDAPPIVLTVTDSDRRLVSLRTTTQRLGGGGRYWFATLGQLGGKVDTSGQPDARCAALEGRFWAPIWRTAHQSGLRSLAARCGV